MRRRARNIANLSAASLLVVALLLAGVWVRSRTKMDELHWRHERGSVGVSASSGRLAVSVDSFPAPPDKVGPSWFVGAPPLNFDRTYGRPVAHLGRLAVYRPFDWPVTCITVPIWLVVVVSLAWPTLWAWRRRAGVASGRNLCPRCGYDLRASPVRCPECGTDVATKPPP